MAMETQRLEFVISAVNRAQTAINQLQQNLGGLRAAAERFNEASQRGAATTRRALSGLSQVLQNVRQAFAAFAQRAAAAFQAVQRAAAAAQQGLSFFGGVLGRVAGMAGGAARTGFLGLAGALFLIGKRGVDVNVSVSRVHSSLTTMLGSGRAASSVLDTLRRDAANTTFSFQELADQTRRLLAFGFNPAQARTALLTLGDVAFSQAGEEGAGALLDRLTLAIGQIKAKGLLQGEEALQLTEAGINVRDALRIPSGMDIADAGLTADQAIPQLLAAMQRRFGGTMARQMSSIPGASSNIGDAADSLTSLVSGGFTQRLGQAMNMLLRFLNALESSRAGRTALGQIAIVMNNLGDALIYAVRQLPRFIQMWPALTDRIAVSFALLQTMGQTLMRILGIELPNALDPRSILRFVDSVILAVGNMVNVLFGSMRVLGELMTMAGTALRFVGDAVSDTVKDMRYQIEWQLMQVQKAFHETGSNFLRMVQLMLQGIQGNPLFDRGGWAGKALEDMRPAMDATGKAYTAVQNRQEVLTQEYVLESQVGRSSRELHRRFQDPKYGFTPEERINMAWRGTGPGTDTRMQRQFWRDFSGNLMMARQWLQGVVFDSARTEAMGGGPFGRNNVQLFPGGGSITTAPGGMPMDDPNDPFAPVRMPDGRVISRIAAQTLQGGTAQIVINVQNADPRQIGQIVQTHLERELRPAFPGPSGF